MKVLISCFGYFGANTDGGNTAFQVACYLRAQSALKRVLCMGYHKNRIGELDDFAIRVIPKWSIQNIASGLLGKIEQVLGLGTARYSRICGEKLFDRTSVQYLTEVDILHCIRPVVPHTIKAAR